MTTMPHRRRRDRHAPLALDPRTTTARAVDAVTATGTALAGGRAPDRRRQPGRATGRLVAVLALLLATTIAFTSAPARAADDMPDDASLTDDDVRAAIAVLQAELLERRDERHHWDPARWTESFGSATQQGGYTALVAYALLESGLSPQTPGLREAVEHLETAELEGTYAVSLRAMAFARLPAGRAGILEDDLRRLLRNLEPDTAGWGYRLDRGRRRRDLSIRQYGALALWRGAVRGARVPDDAWRLIERGYLEDQLPDGGWNYQGNDAPARGSMVAAGLATLAITRDRLHGPALARLDDRAARPALDAFDRGLVWMDRNFTPTTNPGTDRWFEYWAYGVERVGLASGLRTFGGRDWFRELGAELLRRHLRPAEAAAVDRATDGPRFRLRRATVRTDQLAFTLLFLARGRAPVLVSKLRLDDLRWNNRPGDVARFVAWLGERTEGHPSWQVLRLDEVDDDARAAARRSALLWLASDEALPFAGPRADASTIAADPRARALGSMIEAGGLLVGFDEGRGRALTRSLEATCAALWPHLTFEALPDEHPAWTARRPVRGRAVRMRRLSNGVRDLVILVERPDVPGLLQGADEDRRGERDVLANLVLGRTELGPGVPRLAADDDAAAGDEAAVADRAPLRLVHVVPGPTFDPEPAALGAFATWARRALGHPVEVRRVVGDAPIPPAELALVAAPRTHEGAIDDGVLRTLATWAGADERRLVLLQTAGGGGDVASRSAARLAALGGGVVRPLMRDPLLRPADATVAADRHPGFDVETIVWRPATRLRRGRDRAPRLHAVEVPAAGGAVARRLAVATDDDLLHAQLGAGSSIVDGLDRDSARRLLANLLLRPDLPRK